VEAAGGGRRAGPTARRAVIIGVALALAAVPASCGQGPKPEAATRGGGASATTTEAATTTTAAPTGGSLVVEARTEARLTDNFNPFDTASTLSQLGAPAYIYEPLVQYDELAVDQYYPWLAQSWSFSDSGFTITFDLRSGVKWDDGSPFTASDVAYTFDLLKMYPAINDGVPIVSAVATNSLTFVLTLSQPGYAYMYDIARTPISKAGYASGRAPEAFVDTKPDGTGPYVLADSGFSASRVVLTARSGYWQRGEPAISELVFPAYPDAAAVMSALQKGTLDWAATELPDVQSAYVDKDASANHYWAPPVDSISLELNLARAPMGELAVRRAISDAIDRDALSLQTGGGFDPPATSASGLVLPTDAQFLSSSDTGDIDGAGDPALSALVMRASGYHRGKLGYWVDKAGQVVRLSIEDPAGSAFAAEAVLVARQLHVAGFDASASTVPAGRWRANLAAGDFSASVLASASGPSPFYMYQAWLDPALIARGHATGDYEKLDAATNARLAAKVSADLSDYTDSLSDSAGAQSAIESLAAIVNEYLPVVPLLYGVAWGAFSTRHVTGWPASQDPYEPAIPKAPFSEYTVLQLGPSP